MHTSLMHGTYRHKHTQHTHRYVQTHTHSTHTQIRTDTHTHSTHTPAPRGAAPVCGTRRPPWPARPEPPACARCCARPHRTRCPEPEFAEHAHVQMNEWGGRAVCMHVRVNLGGGGGRDLKSGEEIRRLSLMEGRITRRLAGKGIRSSKRVPFPTRSWSGVQKPTFSLCHTHLLKQRLCVGIVGPRGLNQFPQEQLVSVCQRAERKRESKKVVVGGGGGGVTGHFGHTKGPIFGKVGGA